MSHEIHHARNQEGLQQGRRVHQAYIIQCAARITRHRAISLRTASLAFLFAALFSRHVVKKHWKQECKKRPDRNGLSRLLFGCQNYDFSWFGTLQAAPAAHFLDFENCCDFGCPRLHLSFHFGCLVRALSLWKNSEKCVLVIHFRGLTPSRQCLFAGLDCGCVLLIGFRRFV